MRILKCWKIDSTRASCLYTDETHVFSCMYINDLLATVQHWTAINDVYYTSCYPLNDEYRTFGKSGGAASETIVDINGVTTFTIENSNGTQPIATGYSLTEEDKFTITLRHGAVAWANYAAIEHIRAQVIPTSMPFKYRLCMMTHVTPTVLAANILKDFFDTLT